MTKKANDRAALAIAIYWIICGLGLNGYILNIKKEINLPFAGVCMLFGGFVAPMLLLTYPIEALSHIKLKVD